MRPYHLEQIAAFCREHPVERKTLIAPSRQVGYNILTHLTKTGFEWVNLDTMSTGDLAETEFGPRLRSRGLRPMAGDDILVCLSRILAQIKADRPDGYFKPVSVTPSLVRSVWMTLSSIRMAGLGEDDLSNRVGDSKKGQALADLAGAFEQEIQSGGWYDTARLLKEARSMDPLAGHVAILEETAVSAIERRFLDTVVSGKPRVIGRGDYTLPAPESSARVHFGATPEPLGAVGPAGSIPAGTLTEEDRSSVTVWGARGVDGEVKDVLRWILSEHVALDQIELAYTRPATYLPVIVDLADRFGVEVSFGDGVPVTLTRPGRGLRGLLQWVLDGFPVHGLAGLLQAGLFQFERQPDEAATQMTNLAALLLEAPIGERIDRYGPGLIALMLDVESELEEAEANSKRERALQQRFSELRRLARGMNDLEAALPPTDGTTLSDLAAFCLRFLEKNAVVRDGDRDTIARESLTDRIKRYAEDSNQVKTTFGLQMFVDMVDRHTIQVSTAQPGSLYAVDITRAGYTGRQFQFVVGLDVDSFPGRISEDPILLDLERERVSKDLGRKALEAGDRMWHLSRTLGMSPGRVFLGTTAFDPEREDTIVYPSPFIQSAAKQLGYDYDSLPGIGAKSTLDEVDLLLPQRDRSDFRKLATGLYPWLSEGQVAIEQRKLPEFSRFEGWLGKPDPIFEISASGPVFSNTRFERLANCGYRYFLADVLKVRKPDYYEMDPARWLPAKDFGLLLHELYHDFLERLAERSERVDPETHRPLALEMLAEAIERYKERFPIDNLAAHNYEVQRLEKSVETFLRTESLSHATPVRFELTFGYPDAEIPELLNPVTIDLGDGVSFLLAGRIDRVDESDAGLIVWDYKTGSSWRFTQGDLLRGGLNLQWALYAMALERFAASINLDRDVAESGYYFASDRENGLQLSEKPMTRDELRRVVGPLVELVNRGAFLKVLKDDRACMFCDFNAICSREALTSKDMKARWDANRDAEYYEPLDRWMTFERREDLLNA